MSDPSGRSSRLEVLNAPSASVPSTSPALSHVSVPITSDESSEPFTIPIFKHVRMGIPGTNGLVLELLMAYFFPWRFHVPASQPPMCM